jgi:TRAP-type C4-dicarboxylate transport system permease small subunit
VAKNKSKIEQVVSWVFTLCRILVGILVIKTGFDLASGAGSFAFHKSDNIMTGVFVMIIGIYFVFSSINRQFFEDE